MAVLLSALASGFGAGSLFATGPSLDQFRLAWAWSTSGDRLGSAGFEVADLDRDGKLELVASASVDRENPYLNEGRWFVVEFDGSSALQTWSSFVYEDRLRAVRLSQGVEPASIVAATRSRAYIYDASSRHLLNEFPLQTSDTAGFAIADIDSDGSAELVACDDSGLFVHDYLTGVALDANFALDCKAMDVGQLDGDPALEIAVTGGTFGTLVIDGDSLAVQWADLQSSGGLVLVSNALEDENDELLYLPAEDGALRAVDVDTEKTIWFGGSAYATSVSRGDLDGDGSFEILLSYSQGPIEALDELDGQTLFSVETDPTVTGAAVEVADLDFDGDVELVVPVRPVSLGSETIAAFDVASLATVAEMIRTSGPVADVVSEATSGSLRSSLGTASHGGTQYDGEFARVLRFDPPNFVLGDTTILPYTAWEAVSLVAAQLDDDPASEICFSYAEDGGGTIRCEDAWTHEEHWTVHLGESPSTLVAADLDRDGTLELVVGTHLPALYALEGVTGWLRWRTPILWQVESTFSVVRYGNVDLDADLELVAGGVVDGPYSEQVVVFDALSGALEWGPHAGQTLAFDVAQLDGAGREELVIGSVGGEVQVLDPVSGGVSQPLADYGAPIESLRIADFDRDGAPDLALCVGGHLIVRGGAQASDLYVSPYLHSRAGYSDSLAIADLDGNTVPEILVGTYQGLAVFEVPMSLVFADGFESGDTSAWTVVAP